jgi:hypothetical protein
MIAKVASENAVFGSGVFDGGCFSGVRRMRSMDQRAAIGRVSDQKRATRIAVELAPWISGLRSSIDMVRSQTTMRAIRV